MVAAIQKRKSAGHGDDASGYTVADFASAASWLVGARDECEGELARRGWLAEVLEALCPAAPGFEVVLIGPEMKSDWELGAVRSIRGTLHERDVRGKPDFAVLVSSGIGTLLEPLVSCWLPTLAQLLALNVPLCLTCYHEGEAAGEEAVLRAFEAVPLGSSEVNPLAYVLPSRLGDDAAAEVAAAAARAERRSTRTRRSATSAAPPRVLRPALPWARRVPVPLRPASMI